MRTRGSQAGPSFDGTSVPPDWADAARSALGARRVLVAGPADAGKSTFCRVLMRAAARAGVPAALLEADVGQKMVGPPACVTLGRSAAGDEVALCELAFVGTTDPVRGWRPLLEGVARLVRAAGTDLLVVNTGGLLAGPGRRLKAAMLEALAPDLAIVLAEDPGLDAAAASRSRGLRVLRLSSSPLARRKTGSERRAARREAFRSYFRDAVETSLGLRDEAQALPNEVDPPVRLLVGLADRAGRDVGLGILTAFDRRARRVTCLTPAAHREIAAIRWGALVLDERFSERPATG